MPAAGGDRTDPAERPEDTLRLRALREGDREFDREDLAASGDGRFAAAGLVVVAFLAGFGVSTEEASRATRKMSIQQCFHIANSPVPALRVLTRSTDFFTPLLTQPIMHCTRTMPQSRPRSSSMAAAPEHWHCQQ